MVIFFFNLQRYKKDFRVEALDLCFCFIGYCSAVTGVTAYLDIDGNKHGNS